jgi:hypothetical protein
VLDVHALQRADPGREVPPPAHPQREEPAAHRRRAGDRVNLLFWLLIRSVVDLNDPEASSTGTAWFGLGPPLVIGVAIFLLGVVFMVFWRLRDATYWRERAGVAPDPETGDPAPGDPATGGPQSVGVRR